MKFFRNPKSKFLVVLAGIFSVIAIAGAGLGSGLIIISCSLEKYFNWGLWQNTDDVLRPLISISVIAGLFAAISVGAIILYGIFEELKSLSKYLLKKGN